MKPAFHLLFGGLTNERNDYQTLKNAARTKRTSNWSCLKNTRTGDRVLIYCTQPQSGIVAIAEVTKDAKAGGEGDWSYVTILGNIQIIEPPISREEIQKMFPRWAWAKSTRGQTYVDPNIGDALWKHASVT